MAKKSSFFSSVIKLLWLAFFAGILVIAAILVFISKTQIPDTAELENPDYDYASIIYSDEYEEVGRYYRVNREWVTFEDLNPHIVEALVATEDERFYKHSGIDLKGLTRAIVFLGGKGGASTITQQLAKQFFTKYSRNFPKRVLQKLKEWVIAVEFEKRYTKEEIIAMYMNKFEFINGAYGIEAAAKTYFNKKQEKLSIDEAAILVGMLKNPSRYNPNSAMERALNRRNVVMNQMVKNNYLSQSKYDELKKLPIDNSKFKRDVHYEGPAPYFRSTLTSHLKNLLDQDQYRKSDGTKYNIYRDGLKIYTTLNLKMQAHAEAAMVDHMKTIQNRYFDVWEGDNPWTYDATEYQKKIRSESLDKMVRESERFKKLRTKFLSEPTKNIVAAFPKARLRDIDIIRLLNIKKDKKEINKLQRNKIISKTQAKTYEDILASDLFTPLMNQWNKLNKEAKKVFNRKVEMEIFDYSDSGIKKVTKTPLDSIKYHAMQMQLGSVSMDPKTGHVKTWVGGIGNKFFQNDHVTSNRQVGSTFKPFIYTTAIFQQAISPCQKVQDIQYTIPARDKNFGLMESWSPSNSRGTFSKKETTLKEGLKQSLNSVSIWLMKQLGNTEVVKDFTSSLGIPNSKVPNAPSICLGSADLNVLEMTGAYCTFANDGVFNKPVFITKIEDSKGRNIYTAVPEKRRALPSGYNYVMVDMLKYAASAVHYQLDTEFGGKTGTTNDYVDGWFMGITPNLVTGTWVGGEFPWIRFKTIENGQGGRMARPYFLKYMEKIENDNSLNWDKNATFNVPENIGIEIDCSKYQNLSASSESSDSMKMEKIIIPDELEEEFEEEF